MIPDPQNPIETLLEKEIEAHELGLARLRKLKARKDAHEACPTMDDHYTRCLQVVSGGGPRQEMVDELDLGADGKYVRYGYQIRQCMGCYAFILASYDAKKFRVLTEAQAKRWM